MPDITATESCHQVSVDLRLELGFMDSDHLGLWGILDEADAVVESGQVAVMGPLLERLTALVRDHFAHEEAIMQGGYPKAGAHVAQHARFLADLARLCTNPPREPDVAEAELAFVRTWFVRHTKDADQQLADWLRTHSY